VGLVTDGGHRCYQQGNKAGLLDGVEAQYPPPQRPQRAEVADANHLVVAVQRPVFDSEGT